MIEHILNIDVETYSVIKLQKYGLYRYMNDPSFRILIICYSLDGAPVETIDLASGEKIPEWFINALTDPTYLKKAWNAMFERRAFSRELGFDLDPLQWECTMVKAGMLGLPMSLDAAGIALNTKIQKATIGKSLIRIFSIPRKLTAEEKQLYVNKDGRLIERVFTLEDTLMIRTDPQDLPEKWEQYKDYCAQDVYTEMEIGKFLDYFIIPEKERLLYGLDQRINDYGMLIDVQFIANAIHHSAIYTKELIEEAKQLTGLDNPKSVKQLKEWLELEIEEDIPTLKKDAVHDLIKSAPTAIIKRVLEIRQQISKTSVKKYNAMLAMAGYDNRARGVLGFYKANRTGRWAGNGIQPHNLYKNLLPDLDELRGMEAAGKFDEINLLWDTSEALSQLIRTAIIAPPGHTLCMSDFSAIEARVLAWLAVEMWKLDVFKGDGKIYEVVASKIFKMPVADVKKSSKERQRAKIYELLCGYGGSVDAILRDPKNRSIGTDEEIFQGVCGWRDANKRICQFWHDVENAAVQCIKTGEKVALRNLTFYMKNGTFHIKLPSGRSLSYLKPEVITVTRTIKPKGLDADGNPKKPFTVVKDEIYYSGVDQKTKKWKKTYTYGGKLVENIVQAVSRDLLAEKMLALDDAGYRIVLHVHDEVVIELKLPPDDPDGGDIVKFEEQIQDIERIMKSPLSWSKGLPLNADTYCSPFYRKD